MVKIIVIIGIIGVAAVDYLLVKSCSKLEKELRIPKHKDNNTNGDDSGS